MKTKILYLILIASMLLPACSPATSAAQQSASTVSAPAASAAAQASGPGLKQKSPAEISQSKTGGGTPPAAAIAACTGKSEQAACEFTSQKGTETGVCETVQAQLACSPKRDPSTEGQPGNPNGVIREGSTGYNIEQAISDKAQGMTIAYGALAFLTGDLGSDSFFPPGKVADFWGFQYLRDNDPSEMGHAGDFLTSAAMNMLNILTTEQRASLVALAKSQVSQINEYGYKRFVLIDAFRRLLESDLPPGTTGLSEAAVKTYSAALYRLDGQISYARAQLMGSLISAMSAAQKASLDSMVGKGMKEWPVVKEPSDLGGLSRDEKVAVMTYAADMFSWYAGSIEADVYFYLCPERHGTYFGSFYLKDIPAMSNPTYSIPTDLTGDMGEAMLAALTPSQSTLITGLVDIQKPYLTQMVAIREQIAALLRKFMAGQTPDSTAVLGLMETYGQLDGSIIYNLATNFTKVNQTLTSEQKARLLAMRTELLGSLMYPKGAYLYSQAIPMPTIPSSDFLFK